LIESKIPNTSPNWTFVGDTITYEYEKEMNGKQPLFAKKDYSSPKSFSLDFATHQPPSRE
jgi:hypothetical protein